MAVSIAYWINPYGQILPLSGADHVGHIIQAPDRFGTTYNEVERVYAKHNERVGQEGKAREELIINALERGFIRIRLYGNQYWSINVYKLDGKAKKALGVWAEMAKNERFAGPHMPCRIVEFASNRVLKDYTVSDLYYERHLNEFVENYNPQFVNKLSEFEVLPK